jgi:hypothetical protein
VAREREPPPPDLDAAVAACPEGDDMYFREPQQLLGVYAELEESNLFYIQNAQETEEALEELRAKYRDTRSRLDGEVAALTAQVRELDSPWQTSRLSTYLHNSTYLAHTVASVLLPTLLLSDACHVMAAMWVLQNGADQAIIVAGL